MVGVKWISGICGTCLACLEGVEGVCFNQKISGYVLFQLQQNMGHARHNAILADTTRYYTPGTFQQYVLGPANYVTPIPDGISPEVAAPMLCAGVTVYSALRKSNALSGQWVVIIGAGGGLGHLAGTQPLSFLTHRPPPSCLPCPIFPPSPSIYL